MELTKEQMEQLQKDLDAAKAKIAELEKAKGDDAGNVDAAKARKKIEALEKDLKEKAEKLEAYEKEKSESEKAKLSEVERLKAEKAEAEAKAQAAADTLAKTLRENAFGYAALQAGCSNVSDAIKLADLSEFNAEDPESAKAFIEGFKKTKPYLFSQVKQAQVGTTGKEAQPGDEKKGQELEQKLKEAKDKGDPLAALKALS